MALSDQLSSDKFVRTALTQFRKTPKLLQCDQPSVLAALMSLAALSLTADGRLAHLIPYGTTCQLIIDYKGLYELAMRSGKVAKIHADVVCANDVFEHDKGTIIKHSYQLGKPRGEVIGAYAECKFKDGSEKAEIMSVDEIEAIRKRSRASGSGPWVTDTNEMRKKTVFRRLSKWLPLSPEERDVIDKADADSIDVDSLKSAKVEPRFDLTEAPALPEAVPHEQAS